MKHCVNRQKNDWHLKFETLRYFVAKFPTDLVYQKSVVKFGHTAQTTDNGEASFRLSLISPSWWQPLATLLCELVRSVSTGGLIHAALLFPVNAAERV